MQDLEGSWEATGLPPSKSLDMAQGTIAHTDCHWSTDSPHWHGGDGPIISPDLQ